MTPGPVRAAAIIGGAGGIGAAAAIRLAAEGFSIAVLDVDERQGRAVAGSCGPVSRFYSCDVAPMQSPSTRWRRPSSATWGQFRFSSPRPV